MVTQKKMRLPQYLDKISPETFDRLKAEIFRIMLLEKKYKERGFTAARLAEMLSTNSRYVSIVLHSAYHANYSSFVNRLRVDESMNILANPRYDGLSVEDVSDMVGFANRQSFYRSFCGIVGMTPREYRLEACRARDGQE